ncbi:MAG: nucleotidyltransferase domain-containing protein [Vicinamibacterales bacterium]|nr:nucleotidyltransferase domain-containing protein [Vicinamibacterales bacterium]
MADSDIARLRSEFNRTRPDNQVRLIAVFGSRARDDARASSDWDIAYLADPGFDADGLLGRLTGLLGTDHIDLVDLARASGQLRYRVARDGAPVFARDPGEWHRFWTEAVSFWCDAGPVLRQAYAGILQELGP